MDLRTTAAQPPESSVQGRSFPDRTRQPSGMLIAYNLGMSKQPDANEAAARVVGETVARNETSLPADVEAAWEAWSQGSARLTPAPWPYSGLRLRLGWRRRAVVNAGPLGNFNVRVLHKFVNQNVVVVNE
jgi:hypothetical protein